MIWMDSKNATSSIGFFHCSEKTSDDHTGGEIVRVMRAQRENSTSDSFQTTEPILFSL
jgi:hypothetical protein